MEVVGGGNGNYSRKGWGYLQPFERRPGCGDAIDFTSTCCAVRNALAPDILGSKTPTVVHPGIRDSTLRRLYADFRFIQENGLSQKNDHSSVLYPEIGGTRGIDLGSTNSGWNESRGP
jgi:hypothetical protein